MPRGSRLQRKLRGPLADWTPEMYMLRRIDHQLAGANWQRGGGKGQKPKALELPAQRRAKPAKPSGNDIAQRLRNLGLIPASDTS